MSIKNLDRIIRDRLVLGRSMRFYSRFIRNGDLCFDIGANRGDRTDIFLSLGARVLCVEPQESCLRLLREKYEGNTNVTIVPMAVGEREGAGELSVCEEAPTISTMSARWMSEGRFAREYRWETHQEVRITTLDALMAGHGIPVFAKIDVEGYELEVFKGLSRPIRHISFEFTEEFVDVAKECIHVLERIGPLRLNASMGESMRLAFPEWHASTRFWESMTPHLRKEAWGDIVVRFVLPRDDCSAQG